MSSPSTVPRNEVLDLPAVGPAHYARNLIRQVVCELRFPTIFELTEDRPPPKFWGALKKDYPLIESFLDYEFQREKIQNAVAGHQLFDKKRRWKITLRPSTLTIETANYDSFEEFKERATRIWKAAESTLDTDFYTRVGLRYINTVPYDPQTIRDWVRPELSALLLHPLGNVNEFMTKIVGPTEFGGGYIIQAGLVLNTLTKATEFGLDFDLFKEDVAIDEAATLLDKLHDWEFRLFDWSLGPAARAFLGSSST